MRQHQRHHARDTERWHRRYESAIRRHRPLAHGPWSEAAALDPGDDRASDAGLIHLSELLLQTPRPPADPDPIDPNPASCAAGYERLLAAILGGDDTLETPWRLRPVRHTRSARHRPVHHRATKPCPADRRRYTRRPLPPPTGPKAS